MKLRQDGSPRYADDDHWHCARARRLPMGEVDAARRSHYVRAHDGVPIAIDVYLPPGAAAPVSTILRQTRYGRSLLPRAPFRALVLHEIDHYQQLRRAFLAAGFAWVDVDVRGSGASGGTQYYAWNPDEVRDGAQVVDWIIGQPWSSGKVGSFGISYDGTSAEMLLVNRHPAVRAVAPLFSLFDAYSDIAFPGGVHLAWFTAQWGHLNAMLDRNAPHEAFALIAWMLANAERDHVGAVFAARLMGTLAGLGETRFRALMAPLFGSVLAGVRPVDGRALASVVADHAANYDVHAGALAIQFRDDRNVVGTHPGASIDSFSPHAFAVDTAATGAAIYSYSGWRDGAYNHSAIRRHLTLGTPGSRLCIGPWMHSGRLSHRPFDVARPARFDHAAELIAFFAHELDGRPHPGDGQPVHYFTLGEQRWKAAASWPPPGTRTRTLYLAGGRRLDDSPPIGDEGDRYRVDPTAGTGTRSRWRCLIAPVAADYPDRAHRDLKLLVYDSAPLVRPMEVTGHPIVALHVAWLDANDGQIFAYLEDLAPDGRVAYVSEGMLRALHRAVTRTAGVTPVPQRTFCRSDALALVPGAVVELTFDLLPVSYLFAAGHRIRLALAGADADSFGVAAPATIEVHRAPARPSRIELP